MAAGPFRFDRFVLDPADRQLKRDGAPVELNARYLDALALLVGEQGRLVSKERFLAEVWRGVPVTDEALTQCIRTLRRQLGDDAASPRFIETVPKHGYRFVAPVTPAEPEAAPSPAAEAARAWAPLWRLGGAGAAGGAVAGLLGGIVYGLVGISDPLQAGGAASALLVMICITALVGLLGGAGVGLGIGAAVVALGRCGALTILGAGAGGLMVGAMVKLIALDAFGLLLGRSPGAITGASEGAVLGVAVGTGLWLAAKRGWSPRRGAAATGLFAAAAGVLIVAIGGRLMGGSLALLAERFPASRLRLDHLGAVVGEPGFGPLAQGLAAGLEGLLFGACVAAAVMLATRPLGQLR